MRFRFGYSWWSVPLSGALGLLPPFTGADVVLGRFRLRFGPWFRIEVPVEQIASARVAPEEPDATIPMRASTGKRGRTLHMRTAPGPTVVVRFRTPQPGFWGIRISRAGLLIDVADLFAEISFNAADPDGLVAALTPSRRKTAGAPARPGAAGGTKKVAAARGSRAKPVKRTRSKTTARTAAGPRPKAGTRRSGR